MDQCKIGKFIALLRKEKNLTQEQLSEKLNISINAVSKWERGICLMDIGLLKPLSKILDISIVELLNGERIEEADKKSATENTIEKTLEYSSNELKKIKKKITILIPVIVITIIFGIIILDTIQAFIFTNSPLIGYREKQIDEDSYVDRGILVDTYYCVKELDMMTVIPIFKTTNYGCPVE